MTAIICQTCYTRYVPPPMARLKYETECPNCRDNARHSAIDTDLIVDLAVGAVDIVADLVDELLED